MCFIHSNLTVCVFVCQVPKVKWGLLGHQEYKACLDHVVHLEILVREVRKTNFL